MSREEQIERMLFDARCREASALGHARREGRQEEKRQTARNMKAEGLDLHLIADTTGLTFDKVLNV